jgi:hypothetical protein
VAEPAVPVKPAPRYPTPARVLTTSASADGVVVSRPPAMPPGAHARSGVIQRPGAAAPQPARAHEVPPAARPATGVPPAVAPVGARPKSAVAPAREAPADSVFGEDLISEKSLDEVILAYLAEDTKHPK